MNRRPVVIVDADAIVGQVDSQDPHHLECTKISQNLGALNARVLYPVTAILEADAHIQRVLNSSTKAYDVARMMTTAIFNVVKVEKKTLIKAFNYFSPTTSKKNTLFDCIVAAVAAEKKADAIFSFDRFYKRQGFTLASEL